MVNWVTLTKTFVADSAYTHLTVGCFKPYGTMLMDSLDDGGKRPVYSRTAYYYIGQIGVPDSTRHSDTDYVTPPDLTGPYPVDTTIIATANTVKYVFPNAFTPTNQGNNNVFRIIGKNPTGLGGYSLSIFNRWGQRIFFTKDPLSGWDGTYNNIQQDIGTYFYMSAFTVNGEYRILKGDVTLLR
jgi:gliding motility-associated-like protein